MSKFKKGSYVGVIPELNRTYKDRTSGDSSWVFDSNEVYIVIGTGGLYTSCRLVKVTEDWDKKRIGDMFDIPTGILRNVGKCGNINIDNMVRYMAYGIGCDNKSDLLKTEKELKEKLIDVINDSNWTGRILGYKLTPIYEAELTTRLKVFKTPKITRVKR